MEKTDPANLSQISRATFCQGPCSFIIFKTGSSEANSYSSLVISISSSSSTSRLFDVTRSAILVSWYLENLILYWIYSFWIPYYNNIIGGWGWDCIWFTVSLISHLYHLYDRPDPQSSLPSCRFAIPIMVTIRLSQVASWEIPYK